MSVRWYRNRKLLIVLFLVLVIGLAWTIKSIRQSSKSPFNGKTEGYQLKVDLGETAIFWENLSIKVEKISPIDSSNYKINASVTYKDIGETSFNNAKVGAILTYPPEDGYDIAIVKAESEYVVFAIKKSP